MLQCIAILRGQFNACFRRAVNLPLLAAATIVAMTLACPGHGHAGDQKTVAIYGDSLATGLFFGLQEMLSEPRGHKVIRRSKGGTGLVRDEEYDWVAQSERHARADRPDIIIVSLGGNDRQDFTFHGERVERFTDEWWIEYMRRTEQVMMALKRASTTVYWLGIPVVKSARMTQDFAKLNVLFRELCRVHGIIHVDIWDAFRGPDKRFSPFETVSGRKLRVRNRDGIHFTKFGNQRLAQIIAGAMQPQVILAQ